MEGTLRLLAPGLILLGIVLIGLAVEGEVSARRGRPNLATRSLAIFGIHAEGPSKTEMSRIAHRFEAAFEILVGCAALICGLALL